ncbi:hypothetical protein BJX65DRAFT_90990 [Aspergillus insuetus]
MLQNLPPELISDILSLLQKPDVARIRLTSKQLESLATPLLFSDVIIHVDENDLIHIPIQRALDLSFGSKRNLLHCARRITFTSQFRVNYTKRCPHHYRGTRFDDESDDASDSGSGEGDEEAEEEEEDKGKAIEENNGGVSDGREKVSGEQERSENKEGEGVSIKSCEQDKLEDDDTESFETRYPDDDLLEPYELTETEQRDVDRYIPFDYDIENPAQITQIKNRVMAMLIRSREGTLTEFSWDLGICCPAAVLGDGGILPRRQKNIDTIRIINDCRCHGHDYWLAGFHKLKRLTWMPLTWKEDLDALAMGFETFAHQLTLLELDIYDYERKGGGAYRQYFPKSQAERDRPNYFAWDIMGLFANENKCIFQSLERLYLSGVPFEMAEMEMVHAFNWGRLRSLHLRFCSGWAEFLRHTMQSGREIKLRSLTLEPSPILDLEGEEVNTICSFLGSFTGLRELFLSTNEEHGTLNIWKAVVNHKATLRTFVHNQRISEKFWYTLWDEIGDVDPPLLPFTDEEFEMMRHDPESNPLSHLDLEFLGLSLPPVDLKVLLSPFTTKTTLQLLHIRQAGGYSEQYGSWGIDPNRPPHPATQWLTDFGNWAFGHEGILSLKGLAFGDFSYDNRHSHDRYLTMVERTDPPLDVKFAEALAACPQDELNALDSFPWRLEYE